MGDLAAAEQVRSPTMSRLVAEMEAAGLVTRRVSTDDRRVAMLSATPAGRRLLQAGRRRRVAELAVRLEGLDQHELDLLDGAAAVIERVVASRD